MKKERFIIYNLNDQTKMYVEDTYAPFALLKAYASSIDQTLYTWDDYRHKLKEGEKAYIIEDSNIGTLAVVKPKQAIKREIDLYEKHGIKPKHDFNYLHETLGNARV